ncbi:unnamed protein product [Parajaminaea phylloscopi]
MATAPSSSAREPPTSKAREATSVQGPPAQASPREAQAPISPRPSPPPPSTPTQTVGIVPATPPLSHRHARLNSGPIAHETLSSVSHPSGPPARFHTLPTSSSSSSSSSPAAAAHRFAGAASPFSTSSTSTTGGPDAGIRTTTAYQPSTPARLAGLVSPRSNHMALPPPNSALGMASSSSSSASSTNVGSAAAANNPQQPLSLADAIARSQGDITRALDDVLAERNRYCLEANKLSNENVRIWNLMGRIRKENEGLKARLLGSTSSAGPATPVQPADQLTSQTPLSNNANAAAVANRPKPPPVDVATGAPSAAATSNPSSPTRATQAPVQSFASQVRSPLVSPALGEASYVSTTATAHFNPSTEPGASRDVPTEQNHRQEVPMSPGAASVIQQRAAARALQQRQSSTAGHATADTDASRPGTHSVEADDDYSAVDTSSVGGESTEARDTYSVDPQVPTSPPATTPTKAQFDRPRASVSSVASSSHGGNALHRSMGSGDSTFGPVAPLSPRSRKKDLGAMGVIGDTWGGPTSTGMAHSTSNASMRSSKSRLEPREAAVASREASSGGGLSLAQALAEMANSEPPGGTQVLQPRLDDRLLRYATVKVSGTNIRAGERGKEVVSFFLVVEIADSAPRHGLSSWRIEKSYVDILALDAKVRHKHGKAAVKQMGISGAQLPDKTLFKDHAPSKVDLRKVMLEGYLRNLIAISLQDKEEVCTFLCTDVVPQPRRGTSKALFKEGFLTKKGQNLGRWVTRFYSLDGPRLDYFDGRGGALLGSINVRGAQIGRQQKSAQGDADENSYRHAFLVLEKKLRGPELMGANGASGARDPADVSGSGSLPSSQLVRHVLCAESDEERDAWVDVLVRAIADLDRAAGGVPTSKSNNDVAARETKNSQTQQAAPSPAHAKLDSGKGMSSSTSSQFSHGTMSPSPAQGTPRMKRSGSLSRRFNNRSRDGPSSGTSEAETHIASTTTLFSPPASSVGHAQDSSHLPASSSTSSTGDHQSGPPARQYRPSISGPMNGTPIPTGYKFGARDEDAKAQASAVPDRRRFWHRFAGGSGSTDKAREARGAVFGVPLADSIAVSSVSEGLAIPSVVFRCIQFLEKKNAIMEEGIYRLSGSTADVKALREQFDAEGDVDLLADEADGGVRHDPHAVAGLLKTFLRELPTSVLTRELHMDFMRVNDISDWQDRVRELAQLVSALPLPNYSLLRTLCRHLIKVISYQEVNKMTMRNVGIVFSPTLAIPAGVFALFLTSFDYCFYTDAKGDSGRKGVDGPADGFDSKAQDEQTPQTGGEDSHPTTPTTLEGPPPHRTSSLPPARKRSNRNSLNYSEEEAQRIMGTLPMGQHRLLATHPEDPNSYDAGADFLGGPTPSQGHASAAESYGNGLNTHTHGRSPVPATENA